MTLFLTCGFYYQTVIEEFDKQCGLPIFLELVCCDLFYSLEIKINVGVVFEFKNRKHKENKWKNTDISHIFTCYKIICVISMTSSTNALSAEKLCRGIKRPALYRSRSVSAQTEGEADV